MSGLKKYVSITIIMLCIVGINTTDVSGCCECCCCCFCCWPKVKCALCLKEKRFRIQRIGRSDLIVCDECNVMYGQISHDLDAPYLQKVRKEAEEKDGLLTYSHLKSPEVVVYTDPQKQMCVSRWLTDHGLRDLLFYFKNEDHELTLASLMTFIQDRCGAIEDQRERERYAQTYMAGLHMIADAENHTTHTSRMPGMGSKMQHIAAWNGRLVDVLDRAFRTRMKLLTGNASAVHASIWSAWTQGDIPESEDIDAIITSIKYDNGMGYPAFIDYREALKYRNIIPSHLIKPIIRRQTQDRICYIVVPPTRYYYEE